MALRRRDGKVAGHAASHALPGYGALGSVRTAVFIDLVGAGRPAGLQAALMAAYGLTVREAELAARLADGVGLPTVAQAMGIRAAAARTRLKAMFGKMECSTQSDLVAAVSSLRRASALISEGSRERTDR